MSATKHPSTTSTFVRLLPAVLTAALVLGLLGVTRVVTDSESAPALTASTPNVRAITYGSRSPASRETIEHLAELGVTHLALIPFSYQREISVPSVVFRTDNEWYTESDKGIREFSNTARELGMDIILKPHLWLGRHDSNGLTRADIGYGSEEEWKEWEGGYRSYILHHAQLATDIGASIFVVGTELARSAREREAFWRSLISEVREIYGGHVTYAANWWREYEDIKFWDALDFVGVQAYFPVGSAEDNEVDAFKAGWADHVQSLQDISQEFRRPILFTEIGYRSVPGAPLEPWRWASHDDVGTVEPALELQARLYEAFFQSLWHREWFAGTVVWRWHSPEENRREVRMLDFTPQDKPAEEVIRRWFAMPDGR